jgi:hypothetical protein
MKVPERCISVLDMHFKDRYQEIMRRWLYILCVSFFIILLSGYVGQSEILDRVVAIVNNDLILLTEFKEELKRVRSEGNDITDQEVLQGMIKQMIILEEANKYLMSENYDVYQLTTNQKQKLIDEYIEKRIKAFIHIPFEDIEKYYQENKDDFNDKDLYGAWDEIEQIIKREQLKTKLDDHVDLLMKKAYIRIQL